ncbi:hypothetical protein [Maridesulfovibrio sp.]|uniref:hypothetical protein n=1 Tax=Maridesulfovibrio sp. TaxID=2795000 RepID=UPI002AA7ED16|nr:hypothetical protein [Maridesulfovibrio sp.]
MDSKSEIDYWQTRYNLPHIGHLSLEALEARLDDLLMNFGRQIRNGKPVLLSPRGGTRFTLLLEQTMQEFKRRKVVIAGSKIFDIPHVVDENSILLDEQLEAISQQYSGRILVKYGKKEHVQDMLDRGSFLVSPASYYDDESLNIAVKDNELERKNLVSSHGVEINVLNGDGSKGESIQPIGPIEYRSIIETNYYVWCGSDLLQSRLFTDFECDACLVVTEPKIFIEKILDAVLSVRCGWADGYQMISYYDPLEYPSKDVDPLGYKHFRYWYQSEHRLIWLPPENVDKLERIFVEVGPLHDLAEIVTV